MEEIRNTEDKVKIKHKKCTSIWVKTLAFIGMILCSVIIPICAVGAIYCYTEGYYANSFRQVLRGAFHDQVIDDEEIYIMNYVNGHTAGLENELKFGNVAYTEIRHYSVLKGEEGDVLWSYGDNSALNNSYYVYSDTVGFSGQTYSFKLVLGYNLERDDAYRNIYRINQFVYSIRYLVYFIAFAAFIGWVLLFIFLIINAGYNGKSDKPQPCFESKIPFEISLFVAVMAVIGIALIVTLFAEAVGETVLVIAAALAGAVAVETIFILFCICLAIRIKTHHMWKNMLLHYLIKGIGYVFKKLPTIWQAVVGCIAFLFVFFISSLFIGNFAIYNEYDMFGWIIFVIFAALLFALVTYIAITYRRLEEKIHKLASGDLSGDVNRKFMLPLFQRTADDLKTISGGIVISNEKRYASEKTQAALITNVSHDIKTPLTSIINYADLIARENCDNQKINEYAEVLGRQSTRLKRLLEDLIEVSKAQSGSLEVNLEPCVVSNFLTQSAGEYEEKLEKKNLTLITKNTESKVVIMADPRRMWRVFDNLLGNICKYSLAGTRVYLSLEEDEDKCRIIFKNTSESELDMSPEELMKRFVRGDVSREGDGGNGLGLSIASNLVMLQKGTMEISIDGDLFKVTLEFAIYKPDDTAENSDPE